MSFETKYTDDQKREACNLYAVYGSAAKVAKRTGIPARSVRYWTHTDWWAEMTHEVRKAHQDKLDGRFTGIIRKMAEELEDRVLNGDFVVDSKTSRERRRPMSGRDMMAAMALLLDRRAIIRGDPSRITKNLSLDKHIGDMQSKLEEMRKKGKKVPREVEVAPKTPDVGDLAESAVKH